MIQVNKKKDKKTIIVKRPFYLVDTDGDEPVREKTKEGKEYTVDADFAAEMVTAGKARYKDDKKDVEVESGKKEK